MNLWNASPQTLIEALEGAGRSRGYVVTEPDSGEVRASHPVLGPVAASLAQDERDYRGHRGVFLEIGKESRHLLSACVHKTRRGQAAGGVRFWRYATVEDFVRDGLRLSRGMGHKNALAGLWWGGGKGVIARHADYDHRDPELRAAIYSDYGRFISHLQGCYVTAEDAGTTAEDMAWVHLTTRHTTCIPEVVGGSGNPSGLTARGVVAAMEAALEWLKLGTLEGKVVATQGLGNVACFMIEGLLERGVARVIGTDVDEQAVASACERFAGAPLEAKLVDLEDTSILEAECDILSPNATGAMLNERTIPGMRTAIVCGGANNQLEEGDRDARALADKGVFYVPDFLANRMGIVNCANEQYGRLHDDPAILDHLDRSSPTGIHQRCLEVFERAEKSGHTPAREAELLADELSEQLHPIWGDRGTLIIDDLVKSGWDRACWKR
jgi:glutamate dehydrogenase/leucine dehydrogenase